MLEVGNTKDSKTLKKDAFKFKCQQRIEYNRNPFAKDNIDLATKNGYKIPSLFTSFILIFPFYLLSFIRKIYSKFFKLKKN